MHDPKASGMIDPSYHQHAEAKAGYFQRCVYLNCASILQEPERSQLSLPSFVPSQRGKFVVSIVLTSITLYLEPHSLR